MRSGTSSSERPDRIEVLDDAVVQVLADPVTLIDGRPGRGPVRAGGRSRSRSRHGGRRTRRDPGRASVNGAPPSLFVRYRLPTDRPLTSTGTPRNVVIGGWFGGKPYRCGSTLRSGIRTARFSLMIRPSRPWPRGSAPIRARVSPSSPLVMKRSMKPSSSTMPSAAYCAPTSGRTSSTMTWRTSSTESRPATARVAVSRASKTRTEAGPDATSLMCAERNSVPLPRGPNAHPLVRPRAGRASGVTGADRATRMGRR